MREIASGQVLVRLVKFKAIHLLSSTPECKHFLREAKAASSIFKCVKWKSSVQTKEKVQFLFRGWKEDQRIVVKLPSGVSISWSSLPQINKSSKDAVMIALSDLGSSSRHLSKCHLNKKRGCVTSSGEYNQRQRRENIFTLQGNTGQFIGHKS